MPSVEELLAQAAVFLEAGDAEGAEPLIAEAAVLCSGKASLGAQAGEAAALFARCRAAHERLRVRLTSELECAGAAQRARTAYRS
jgi:hypothetical protein